MRTWIGATVLSMLLATSCSNGGGDPRAASPTGGADSPSSSVQVLDDCPELPCEGPLEPGKYRWTFHEPRIEFEIRSPGWTWGFSGGGDFRILADASPTHEGLSISDGIYFLLEPTIASRDCQDSSEPGVGRSVGDLVEWLQAAPGLDVTEPTPVTVGGLDGMQLDLTLDPAWKRTCFFSEGQPVVPLVFNGSPLGGYHWAILPRTSMRWYLLESKDGVVLIDLEDGPNNLARDDLLRTGGEIVDSMAFTSLS
jgi:hypothetical protein